MLLFHSLLFGILQEYINVAFIKSYLSEFSEREVLEVLKNMKSNKSPGSDGFTVEIFLFFWKDLKLPIVNAINCIFFKKELPASQRLEIISCIPKGNKTRQFLKTGDPLHY